jgi:hypothetical protein
MVKEERNERSIWGLWNEVMIEIGQRRMVVMKKEV